MKYYAPFGSIDPNAGYVDRNTPAATRGSVPPAKSIEMPMREIVDVITRSGFVPDDPLQLARAIQSKGMNYASAGGTANALTITLNPAPLAENVFPVGMSIIVYAPLRNTGAMTLSANGGAPLPIRTARDKPARQGDFPGSAFMRLVYVGGFWRMEGLSYADVPQIVAGDMTFYVRPDGNDMNEGTANTAAGAWATVVGALNNISARYAANAYTATVNIAAGSYVGALSPRRSPMRIVLAGVSGNNAAVTINAAVTDNITLNPSFGCDMVIQDLTLANSKTDGGYALLAAQGAYIQAINIRWGFARTSNIRAQSGAVVVMEGAHSIAAGTGNKNSFLSVENGAIAASSNGLSLDVGDTFNLSKAFAEASLSGVIDMAAATFTNKTNATGPRYNVATMGLISVGGAGASVLPGTTAGTALTGGGYY